LLILIAILAGAAVAFEVGMQNAGLGSVLALAHLGEAGAVPSAFYTVLCVVTSAAAIPLLHGPPARLADQVTYLR
jgi:predicted Na+-dependent transporter